MAGKKQRDQLIEKLDDDGQEEFEDFLDHLEAIDDSPDGQVHHHHHSSTKSSIGLLFTKVFVVTTVVISSVLWFAWPEINSSQFDLAQHYQEDGKLERVVDRLQALEEALKLSSEDKAYDEPLNASHQEIETDAAKRVQQKPETATSSQPIKVKEESLKQDSVVKAQLLAKKQAEEKSAKLEAKHDEAAKLLQQETLPKTVQYEPQQVKAKQQNSDVLNVDTTATLSTPSTATASQAVTRPYVALTGKKFYIYQISVDVANVRSTPSSDATVVAKLKQGTNVIVLKQEGDWYQIRLNKRKPAWVYHTLLK
ncbi:SH3 domain-containing protein [Mariprofundus sp. EBB-1]|uniref:SH3 domain-containing protein n=1 Tax=Mariprofundus sp. EBB-1 TaxID=2650971 RepID=UPI000EF180DF|nr:SH3 domain-containing protein [Mariprofundus sp. EBB-1]RLL50787.1 SH3 domain-containing protein [Mariprofundus sp. EBB-1]